MPMDLLIFLLSEGMWSGHLERCSQPHEGSALSKHFLAKVSLMFLKFLVLETVLPVHAVHSSRLPALL